MSAVGGEEVAGKFLKATSGWRQKGNGIDTYGFSAMSGGLFNSDDNVDIGGVGVWWSSSEDNSDDAYGLLMAHYDDGVSYESYDKGVLISVRCVKN